MLKKSIAMLVLAIFFVIASCSAGGPYGELKAVFSQQIGATEKLISDLQNADNAGNVAAAYKAYNDAMERLIPKYKEIAEKYPDLDDEGMPADMAAQIDKLEEMGDKLGAVSEKSAEYMLDPEVSKEMQRTMDIMINMM